MRKLEVGVNDLASQHPEVARQWHPKRNRLAPDEVTRGTKKNYWWLGDCGHEWEASPVNRTKGGAGCPFCSGNRVLPGFNDLATTHPELVAEWSPDNDRGPDSVSAGSTFRAIWVCRERGHEWVTAVGARKGGAVGCWECKKENGYGPRRPSDANPSLASSRPDLAAQLLLVLPEFLTFGSAVRVPWICEAGHTWMSTPKDRNAGYGCRRCAFISSAGESEVAAFLTDLGMTVESSARDVIGRLEIDMLVRDRRVGVEYNGVYWHSEKFKGRNYHRDKSLAAEAAGYQLIHVWEDDWRNRRGIVETMLKRKLGVSDEPRLNARSLSYRQVTVADSVSFLESNHLQGRAGGSWRGGLFDGDNLVALMLMKRRSEGHYELTRFATSAIVRGGHSKLLKRAIEELQPESIVTFADRGVSDGGVYAACGFVRDGEIPPDYSYLVQGSRVHKFNYRKARFKSDPELKYVEGLTERELAELNGLKRIYDAGKVRWVWNAKAPSE